MKSIYWFRNDLRLKDNQALNYALNNSDHILFIHIDDTLNNEDSSWGFKRRGKHRSIFMLQGLEELQKDLNAYGHKLNRFVGGAKNIFEGLIKQYKINSVFCEAIFAHEEQEKEKSIMELGVTIHAHFQSSLYMPEDLPFKVNDLPDTFTQFRNKIEAEGIVPEDPVVLSERIKEILPIFIVKENLSLPTFTEDYVNSSFPISDKKFKGGERNANLYIHHYFKSKYPETYKLTRNNLMGIECSTKFSPWLSLGFISPNQIYKALKEYERKNTANESTYWIFFELLWRDYFRFLFMKYRGEKFYKKGLGLSNDNFQHDEKKFIAWKDSRTPSSFINAGMNELNQTGFLSNRMRQIVASYLVNELGCDWRAGAAWFESQLIDYDVYSNYGNWSYISGFGTDPRGGRHFNTEKQKSIYDQSGAYESKWGKP